MRKTLLVWFALIGLFVGFYILFQRDSSSLPSVPMSDVFTLASEGELTQVEWNGDVLTLRKRDGSSATAALGDYRDAEVRDYLESQGVRITSGARRSSGVSWPPMLIGVGVIALSIFLFLRARQQGGLSNIFSLRRTNAKLLEAPPETRFTEVGGHEAAIERLRDVVSFLQAPERWQRAGARAPRGVLLEGEPGVGKTLLARALAGEAKVPFFVASGGDFVELFVGVGAARMRDLFEQARKKAPCVIFIDELDAIGRKRGANSSALVHQEREQTLNQLLVELDGFRPLERVVVVAATNRGDVLDPALTRPGRFDVRLELGVLSAEARRTVLAVHTRNKKLSNVNLDAFAERMAGATGAELEALANDAALLAVRAGGDAISTEHFEAALQSRKSRRPEGDALDAALLQATGQFTRPIGAAIVRVELRGGRVLEGSLDWVDPMSLKLNTKDGAVVVARASLVTLTALEGTAGVSAELLRAQPTEMGVA